MELKNIAFVVAYVALMAASLWLGVGCLIELKAFVYNTLGFIVSDANCHTETVGGDAVRPEGTLDVSFVPLLADWTGMMNMTIPLPPACDNIWFACCSSWLGDELRFRVACSNETMTCVVEDFSNGVIQHDLLYWFFGIVGVVGFIGLAIPPALRAAAWLIERQRHNAGGYVNMA